MRVDAVVIGAGTAGMVAAARLAEEGRRVVVAAKGVGSTRLAPGTIDVLGYAPERVDHPAAAIPAFVAARPEHPYGRVGVDGLERAIAWLKERVDPIRYVGSLDDNVLLPTAVGAAKPTAVVPETMAAGDLARGGSFLLCGLRGYKDFYPALAADNLTAWAKVDVRAVELHPPLGGEPDVGPLGFARRFEEPEFRRAIVRDVLAAMGGEDAVGFPALLGFAGAREAWTELQDALGRPVFEVSTLPPSVPGIRLAGALESAVRRAGGRVLIGCEVVDRQVSARRVEAVFLQSSARRIEVRPEAVVLATGGLLTGGIELGSDDAVRETVFDLPLRGVPADHASMFSSRYFGPHPFSLAGLAVDERMRPVDAGGSAVYDNLYAAGAVLGGAESWREKSGEGISLGTGFKAAEEILR
ncbi:MAG: glycerol-3-phosphate dehydrogenase subunit GlpB [Acidimicrobiales bacterium]